MAWSELIPLSDMRPLNNCIKPPVSHMFNPGTVYKSQSGHTDIIVNTTDMTHLFG